jgi:hypothetical protein
MDYQPRAGADCMKKRVSIMSTNTKFWSRTFAVNELGFFL